MEATADLLLTQLPALQPVSPRCKAISLCCLLEFRTVNLSEAISLYDARENVLFNSSYCLKDSLLYHAALADFKFINLLQVKNSNIVDRTFLNCCLA